MKNILQHDGELYFIPDYFTVEESSRLFTTLINEIAWEQKQIKFMGKVSDVPRLTAWYGAEESEYKYSGIINKAKIFTPALLEIKNKIEQVANVTFNSVLLNRYRNGKDSVAWHSDDEKELGVNTTIASVSFGAARKFNFRHKQDNKLKHSLELSDGSLVIMSGATQHNWEHCVPKTAKEIGERINLTFRIINK